MSYQSAWRIQHESFLQPDDGAIRVWRYLDLARLVAVLSEAHLPFVRMDLLGDEAESSLTLGAYESFARKWPAMAELSRERRHQRMRDVFVSSWHASVAESEAMWRLYCGPGAGVALQTTYEKLDRSLPASVFFGRVQYLDYEDAEPKQSWFNDFNAVMRKRSAFEYAGEIRAVVSWRDTLSVAAASAQTRSSEKPPAYPVPWNVAEVLEHIYVSPYAEDWYAQVVRHVVDRFAPALNGRIQWSRMKAAPPT